MLPSLKLPTQTEEHSPIRKNRKYITEQQILKDRKTRDLVRKAATMPNLPKMVTVSMSKAPMTAGGEPAISPKASNESAALKMEATAAINHITQVTAAGEALTILNKGLGAIFVGHYGVEAYQCQRQPPSSCHLFFEQVRGRFHAEALIDSVL
jgi:hypothetical protein